jgi:hypothetical protein
MTAALDRLFEILGEPTYRVDRVPWERAEPEAGLRFPLDYKAIIDRYGTFEIYEYLTVRGPFRGRPQSDMPEGFLGYAASSRDEAENVLLPENGTEPSPDGELVTGPDVLLSWGGNIAGDRLFWLLDGEPDNWPIAIWFCGGPWVVVRSGMAEFLADVVTRRLPEQDNPIPVQGPENPDWTPGEEVPPLLTSLGGWEDAG